MSELKQQSGYTRAPLSAQPLGGAIPVIDPNKKGDLQKLFSTKAPSPFADSPAAKAAALNDTVNNPGPRNNAPQQTQQQATAKKDAPQSPEQAQAAEQQAPAYAQTAPIDNKQNNQQNNLQAHQPAAENAAAAPLTFVPPQFTPVLSAGVLSALHHDNAIDTSQSPDGYKQGDEFKFGTAAGRQQRRLMERIEDSMEANREEGRTDNRTLLMQYAAEQQRQQFMRSTEYAVAMNTVDREIRKLRTEREVVGARVDDLKEKVTEFDQKIETGEAEVAQDEADLKEHKDLNEIKKENQDDQDALDEKFDKSIEIMKDVDALHSASLKLDGKDVVITVMEDGKPTKYKVDENGQKQKMESGGIYSPDQWVFQKKDDAGNITYVGSDGRDVTPEQKAQIDKALKAAGVKAEDAIPSHDDVVKAREKAQEDLKREDASSSDINKAMNKEEASRAKLESEAKKLGLSQDDLATLDTGIASMEKEISDKKAQIERWKQEKTKTVEELKKEEDALGHIDKRLAESTKFKEQLQNGEFKNAKEMEAAMPGYLKSTHNLTLADRKQQEQVQTQDNTSRANGSAAASYDGAANSGAISGKFQTAATNTPPEAAPQAPAPAPDNDMEYVATRQQPKTQAAGMTP